MIEIWSKLSEQGTWTPFSISMFGELNILRNQYELQSMNSPLIRELILNGKRIWLHPDITNSMHTDLNIAREWAMRVVREELRDRSMFPKKAHPVHDIQDTEQAMCVVEDDAADVQQQPRVAAPLKLIDLEILK